MLGLHRVIVYFVSHHVSLLVTQHGGLRLVQSHECVEYSACALAICNIIQGEVVVYSPDRVHHPTSMLPWHIHPERFRVSGLGTLVSCHLALS